METKRKYWFMNIKDKDNLENGKYCPPHRLPHTLPIIGDPVIDEPCHIHRSRLRMIHHRLFCKIIKCPNYYTMLEEYRGK